MYRYVSVHINERMIDLGVIIYNFALSYREKTYCFKSLRPTYYNEIAEKKHHSLNSSRECALSAWVLMVVPSN